MPIIRAPHPPYPAKLREVVKQMRELGPPRLHAYWRDGTWHALEGSHRTAAAHQLGLTPIILPVRLRDSIDHDTVDVPSRRVKNLLAYYDAHDWWSTYEFPDLTPGRPTARHRRCPRCNQRLRVKPGGELEEHLQIPSAYGYTPAQCLPASTAATPRKFSREVP